VSQWRRCKRRDFIRRLRKLGFDGPYSGTRHQFMVRKQCRLAIPSNAEYSVPQLRMMLREVEQIWVARYRQGIGLIFGENTRYNRTGLTVPQLLFEKKQLIPT